MGSLHEALGLCQIAIDGKTLRSSGTGGLKALHLVSAWATANSLSLGQVVTEEKSNEITAIPKLLELLDVNGAMVSIAHRPALEAFHGRRWEIEPGSATGDAAFQLKEVRVGG